MPWIEYGLLHSLFRAGFAEASRVYRVDPLILSFWHALFGCLILLPLLPFMVWPEDGRFYFAAGVIALIMAVGTMIQLNLAAQKSGRVSSIYMPLEAVAAFAIWVAVTPSAFVSFVQDPRATAGVVTAFAIACVAMMKIRSQDISFKTFSVVAPVGVTYAVAGVVTKLVMPEHDVIPTAMAYVLVTFAVTTAVMGIVLLVKRRDDEKVFEGRALRAGIVTGALATIAYSTFIGSVALAPNPGYVSLIAMLLPVWMMMFHKMIRLDDKASPGAAVAMVAAVIILVVSQLV